ncbi:MAG TPA: efflux RND transporter periplasmic adaptor subunit [Blastocatellia bacterium]|nr:efflux RND transporter periplasmic adaptor subunit [Blastocatellia bacterium]
MGQEVSLSPAALAAAKIEIEAVTERQVVALLGTTGSVEPNQEQTQSVTPLVSGRVERVYAVQGDVVRAGAPLAVITSPEVAETHGKLLEAETRRELAERNVARVQKAENRAGVLSAKAKLAEAEATLKRTQRLIELGAGAGKDLTAAETGYATAKAEFDYQSNIALNREVQEAQAELATATTEVNHLRQSLRALGDTASSEGRDRADHDISLVTLRAPLSGTVIERFANPGAGIQAGSPLFTIGNLSTVWVVANVPDSQVGLLRVGAHAEIQSSAAGIGTLSGKINYIDSRLDEQTRTGRVRVEVANDGGHLKTGMFVTVGFQASAAGSGGSEEREIVVPSDAIQRIGERTVVFVPKGDEPGHFDVRDVQLGGELNGYHRILAGLTAGENVVSKGSFTLKTQLMKGELGEE